jgi:hypothetical protein
MLFFFSFRYTEQYFRKQRCFSVIVESTLFSGLSSRRRPHFLRNVHKLVLHYTVWSMVFTKGSEFVGAFAKLWKVTTSFLLSLSLFVRIKHSLLPLDGFSLNLVFGYLSKNCRESSSFIKIGQKWRVLYISVSQPPGRGLVPGPGINYTGPREVNILQWKYSEENNICECVEKLWPRISK